VAYPLYPLPVGNGGCIVGVCLGSTAATSMFLNLPQYTLVPAPPTPQSCGHPAQTLLRCPCGRCKGEKCRPPILLDCSPAGRRHSIELAQRDSRPPRGKHTGRLGCGKQRLQLSRTTNCISAQPWLWFAVSKFAVRSLQKANIDPFPFTSQHSLSQLNRGAKRRCTGNAGAGHLPGQVRCSSIFRQSQFTFRFT
jgi:hypothetical protein